MMIALFLIESFRFRIISTFTYKPNLTQPNLSTKRARQKGYSICGSKFGKFYNADSRLGSDLIILMYCWNTWS